MPHTWGCSPYSSSFQFVIHPFKLKHIIIDPIEPYLHSSLLKSTCMPNNVSPADQSCICQKKTHINSIQPASQINRLTHHSRTQTKISRHHSPHETNHLAHHLAVTTGSAKLHRSRSAPRRSSRGLSVVASREPDTFFVGQHIWFMVNIGKL